MNISEFFRLRRQNDIVKIALLYFAFGIALLIITIVNAIKFYVAINEPAEYSVSKSSGISNEDINSISGMEDVLCVSRSINESVSIKYQVESLSMPCAVVSKDYIEKIFNIKCDTNSKTFYVNEFTLNKLKQEFRVNNDSNIISVKYSFDSEAGTEYKIARIVAVEDSLHTNEIIVYTYDTDLRLQKEATKLHLVITEHDLDGSLRTRFDNLGFTFTDDVELISWKYELEIWLLKLKSGILISVMSLLAGIVMYKRELKTLKNS